MRSKEVNRTTLVQFKWPLLIILGFFLLMAVGFVLEMLFPPNAELESRKQAAILEEGQAAAIDAMSTLCRCSSTVCGRRGLQ